MTDRTLASDSPDPQCPHCGGTGEYFWHEKDCQNPLHRRLRPGYAGP